MKTTLKLPEGEFELNRYPLRSNETLQAWDAADEYLISHLSGLDLPEKSHIFIANDGFGALSCWCTRKGFRVTHASDSVLSQLSTEANLDANSLPQVEQTTSLGTLPGDIDVAVMKLPKNNRLLVWQLQQLSNALNGDVPVVVGAKAKDIHTSTLKLFEKHLGTTTTSLARKKARLIFCQPEIKLAALPAATTRFQVEDFGISLENHANVFSSESLDIAAYLMLGNIPQDPALKNIIDLGCGNGVLSVQAAKLNPQATITAVDESHMAIASATLNLKNNGASTEKTRCVANNCLSGFTQNSADLVLCNPPFHQLSAVTDHIAWQMFCDAKRVLEPEGKLLVIGNRHLGYHAKLKRLFGNATVVASNRKFVIVQATKA